MAGHKILVPKTENPPAKVRDEGIINLVKAGRAAYNAKNGELLLLPEGASDLRRVMNSAACDLQSNGFQRVNCASDEAIFSLAERYVREWGNDATAYCEGRGREIRIICWNPDESSAAASCERAMSSLLGSLKGETDGKSAVFSDYRIGSVIESAGFTSWQSHIGGDEGSFEADPKLNKDYMPQNPLCKGMGINSPLKWPAN